MGLTILDDPFRIILDVNWTQGAIVGMKIGYARTSTVEQVAGLEAQERDLRAQGCDRVFSERLSSVDAKRPQLDAAIDYLRDGDALVVTKLDRLARSVSDLLAIKAKVEARGASLVVVNLGMDTSTPTGRLILNVLGGVAQFEREIMLERQREGIAKAKAEGKYKGRKPTARAKAADILRLKEQGMTVPQIIELTGVGRSSIFSILAGAKNASEAAS